MSSEIRVNKIQNRSGLSTVTFSDTGVTIAGILTVSENLNVGGVLTYEDVTNVDSVGLLTARSGIRIGAGTTVGPVSGIVTYFGDGSGLTNTGAISAIASDGANRVLTSDGDGTATAHSFVTIESSRLSVNRGSGSGAFPLIVRRTDASGIIAEFANSSGYGLLIGQNSATGEAYLRTGTGQPMVFTTNAGSGIANERLRITSDGDIGVGVASPDGRFHIMGGNLGGAGSVTANSAGDLLVLESNQSDGMSILVANDERANIYFGTTGTNGNIEAGIQYAHEAVSTTADRRAMIFRSGGGERMRIQGDTLRIGDSTSSNAAGKLQVIEESGSDAPNDCNAYFETNAGDWNIKTYYNKAGTHYHMVFVEQGTERGRIKGNDGSNVEYLTGSDYRWKENVVRMTGDEGIDICKKLKPSKYNWIENREVTGKINTVDGFIAHEVDEAGVKGAVSGEKDAVNEDGSIDGQMLDYGQITPVLTAAIKGLIDKVETLEAKVATLEGS